MPMPDPDDIFGDAAMQFIAALCMIILLFALLGYGG